MELCLGRFGDRRLEKGGPFFWVGWLLRVAGGCGCAGWAAIGRERFA
jgi:hypothetical protein